MERFFFLTAGINGFLAVALGAFGAHGLEARLGGVADGAKRLGWWETAAHYHLIHAVALLAVGYLAARVDGVGPRVAGWAFLAGMLLFSGSLYTMTLTGIRALGAVTPLGGLCLLVGWVAVCVTAFRL